MKVTSPVIVSTTVDERSGRLDDTQANKTPLPKKKEPKMELGDPLYSEIPEWLQEFGSYHSMTPSRHERHCSTSSSSSSSSPTTATSSKSETREREDQSEINSSPVLVSSPNADD